MPRSEDNNTDQARPAKRFKSNYDITPYGMARHGIQCSGTSKPLSPEGEAFIKRLEAKSTEEIREEINQINALLFQRHSGSMSSSSVNHVDSPGVASSNNEDIVESIGEAPIS